MFRSLIDSCKKKKHTQKTLKSFRSTTKKTPVTCPLSIFKAHQPIVRKLKASKLALF